MDQPILVYPDTNAPYVLFTDASKYAWAGVLTQKHTSVINGETVTVNHPVAYVSGLFRGSQLNWAALTKEAYAIYMSVRKLTYYLTDAQITLRSDHLPLKKFLKKNTLNAKVNNWAVELETYKIQFEYIQGIKNTLVDTLSRLITIDPDVVQPQEPEGQEFGYAAFEELPPITVENIEHDIWVEAISDDTEPRDPVKVEANLEIKMPLSEDKLRQLQSNDANIRRLRDRCEQGRLDPAIYCMENGLLMRKFLENGLENRVYVLPQILTGPVLILAHNESGHNGYNRTYAAIKRKYYWKGMKKDIWRHCKFCHTCMQYNTGRQNFIKLHFSAPASPMQFIAMDLIGEITPKSSKGNSYALTVVCMLTGFTWCIPIPNKKAETVLTAYLDNVYSCFGGSQKILSDNGTEFKNKLFEKVASELGVQRKVYSPKYRPQSNGRIEGFHKFLKVCMSKHIKNAVEWDEAAKIATATYNFFPGEHSKESPFFAMFGRDPVMPLENLIKPAPRYLGTEECLPNLEAMKNMYQMIAMNLEKARARRDKDKPPTQPAELKPGDLVYVKNHVTKTWDPKFQADCRVVRMLGKTQVEIKDNHGKLTKVHISDVKPTTMVDKIADQVPDYSKFGRATKLRLNPKDVPDLDLQLPDKHQIPEAVKQELQPEKEKATMDGQKKTVPAEEDVNVISTRL